MVAIRLDDSSRNKPVLRAVHFLYITTIDHMLLKARYISGCGRLSFGILNHITTYAEHSDMVRTFRYGSEGRLQKKLFRLYLRKFPTYSRYVWRTESNLGFLCVQLSASISFHSLFSFSVIFFAVQCCFNWWNVWNTSCSRAWEWRSGSWYMHWTFLLSSCFTLDKTFIDSPCQEMYWVQYGIYIVYCIRHKRRYRTQYIFRQSDVVLSRVMKVRIGVVEDVKAWVARNVLG